jgi:hypothetical protein
VLRHRKQRVADFASIRRKSPVSTGISTVVSPGASGNTAGRSAFERCFPFALDPARIDDLINPYAMGKPFCNDFGWILQIRAMTTIACPDVNGPSRGNRGLMTEVA